MPGEVPGGENEPGGRLPAAQTAATRDAVEKSKTLSFEKFKSQIEGDKKTLNEKHQIYVTHTDHSRKISSDQILNVLLKKAKLRGSLHEEFPFRINPQIDTTEGRTQQAIHIFVGSEESYENCAKIDSIEVEGHTLKVSTGDIFNNKIAKKKSMKRVTLKNVPVFCVVEFARQLADYVEINDIDTELQISAQGSMSTKVEGFKKPMPRHLHVNRNGYTVRAEVKVEGYTLAEITKFNNLGLLNKPWSRPPSTPGVDAWKAGAAIRPSKEVLTCYFCYEPGHAKQQCVKHKVWKEKMDLRVCNKCGEKGHIARWCGVQEQRTCDYCKEIGHISPRCRKKKEDEKNNLLQMNDGNYPPLNNSIINLTETGAADTSGASLETIVPIEDDMEDAMKEFYEEPDEQTKVPYEDLNEGEKFLRQQQLLEAQKKLEEAVAAATANMANGTSAPKKPENHFFENAVADNAEIFRAIQIEKSKDLAGSNTGSLHGASGSKAVSRSSSRSSSRNRRGTEPYQMPSKSKNKNTTLTVTGSISNQKPVKSTKPVLNSIFK